LKTGWRLFSALCLAAGVIVYITKVNDEISYNKKPSNGEEDDGAGLRYYYGWAFYFAVASIVTSTVAAVTNTLLYLRRRDTSLKDMMMIKPGLEK
jgi:hypothetical protein